MYYASGCPWPADPSLVSTPSGPTGPLSCQLAKHLLGLFPNPFIPAGFPWLQNSIEYHASVEPLCPQTRLLPPLFGSIMQKSDSTKSAGSSSIRPMGGTRRRWKGGKKREVLYSLSQGPSMAAESPLQLQHMQDWPIMLLLPLGTLATPLLLVSLLPNGGSGFLLWLLLGLLPTPVWLRSSSITWVANNP